MFVEVHDAETFTVTVVNASHVAAVVPRVDERGGHVVKPVRVIGSRVHLAAGASLDIVETPAQFAALFIEGE
jgi:hypothetical protein